MTAVLVLLGIVVFCVGFAAGAWYATRPKPADDVMAVVDAVQSDTPLFDAVAAELDAILWDFELEDGAS